MRSARLDDATARSRIRDAALHLFATAGFGTPLRAISSQAGVSPALVVHHFGSKDGLRDECDEYAFAAIRAAKAAALGPSGPDQLLVTLATVEQYTPVAAYLMQVMRAGGERARAAFAHFVEDAEAYLADGVAAGTVRPSRDEKARVRWLTLTGMGAMLLAHAVDDPPPADLAAWLRRYVAEISLPALETFTDGLLTDRRMLDTYLAYVSDPPEGSSAHR
ncbi:MAG TPA: TetR family transcriptional regulator [Actinotalea sp.]|nr:TetR family transcriptional regulator [Actinotalea sp.]